MVSDDIPPLSEALPLLRAAMTDFPASIEHYVPDRVLYDHAIDVAEQAIAVDTLSRSEVPRAAYCNARAAMEAAQDLLFLAADSTSYDQKGCRARAAVVLENQSLQKRFATANEAGAQSTQPVQSAESVLIEEATEWDKLAPGRGYILRAAFEAVQASVELQRHWSGFGRKDLAAQLAVVIAAEPGWAEMHDALYGAVSTHSHPRPRGNQRMVQEHEGGLRLTGLASDAEVPSALAALACLFAIEALSRRRSFFKAAA